MISECLVGVIDSGHAPRQSACVQAARRFRLDSSDLIEEAAEADRLGHGTAVVDTLTAEAGPVRLCVAQVFSELGVTSPVQVAAAILWLIEQKVRLINLSLGLRHDRPILQEACLAAESAGILLCASSPAQGDPVFPASYQGVLRITGDARCQPGQWSWLDSAQADFGAPVRALNGAAGASIACATISGRLARFLYDHPSAGRAEAFDYLRQHATYVGREYKGARHD